jgi:hypothetical protein
MIGEEKLFLRVAEQREERDTEAMVVPPISSSLTGERYVR